MRVGDNLAHSPVAVTHGLIDVNATGVALTFRPSTPARIIRFGMTCFVEVTGTAIVELQLVTHALDGTPSSATQVGGTELAGVAKEVGAVQYCNLTEEVIVKPGDVATLNVSGGWTAGDGILWLHYQMLNWDITGDNANYSDATPATRMFDVSSEY